MEKGTWNLDSLYKGFNEDYHNDLLKLESIVDEYILLVEKRNEKTQKDFIEAYLTLDEKLTILVKNLYSFASLTQSTNVTNQEALSYTSKIQSILRKSTKENVLLTRYLKEVDLDKLASESELIKKYLYNLQLEQESAKHLLSEKEEVLYSKLSELSSSSWSRLQGLATSNLSVIYDDKEITLSEVRNLAYDYNPDVRKKAYQAELKAYEKVDDFVALALTNIKREVNTMNELRGYSSALEKTLLQSRMKKETLDAMLEAIYHYQPHFEKYLLTKAQSLGHKNGLPFYDLFAPMGKLEKTYNYQEAQELVKEAFYGYSEKLGNFAKKAFDNNWVDVYPKKGKRGGAFCSNQPQIKESRILTNFTGSLSDCLTIAHELGHGYHGEVISENAPLHWSYPMPLAETASIFCETVINNHLLSKLSKDEEKLSILENSVQDATQVIIDILSRFIFETKVLDTANRPISKDEMKNFMIDAQKKAYGKGLDENNLHPYMWLNKGHYYSAGLNFYNFPYAFGLLFSKGLYAQYLKDKKTFIQKYDKLLALTTKASAEDVALSMNIDITKKEFWMDSLEMIKRDIDRVNELINKQI
ncbi:Oligoendopeptidase, pepF/M3 family [Alteracholeplasma palmae J233]|uniref:Oligoendopeptidase, pepF/M3 family n=1 Tax=Alteracholeplasma palmae (strain ATCC 49389 / J233) TaxID=1318466 RepID=U4KQK1_ALTPJ|nr:M3 family oligoendopeptidase [Alteracholeplasma palmae]CCV64720.1 Oligoendopeptidase, pepF/M3 family [Alteracholeplasma palmae J233]